MAFSLNPPKPRSDVKHVQRQLITVENKSSVLSPHDLFQLVWGVGYQVWHQYNESRWVTGGFAPAGHVIHLPEGVKPPAGAWNLILLDHSDQQGALGYHDDENGSEIPYAEVFAVDSQQDGSTVSAVASHEAIEMLVDPNVASPRVQLRRNRQPQWYIVEACDAVQGNDYDVGEPMGKKLGITVSDFCLPSWWELEPGSPYSYRESVRRPWELAPQGYISVAPAARPNDWTQIFGAQQERLPKWASRLPRIHGG